jgi:hypothetical protein
MISARSNALKPAPQRLCASREIIPGRGEPGVTGYYNIILPRPCWISGPHPGPSPFGNPSSD